MVGRLEDPAEESGFSASLYTSSVTIVAFEEQSYTRNPERTVTGNGLSAFGMLVLESFRFSWASWFLFGAPILTFQDQLQLD